MVDNSDSDNSAADSQDPPPHQPPGIPPNPIQSEPGLDPNYRADNQQDTARELAREFRWVEVTSLVINGVLAVVGVIALCIYSGQLKVMRGQLGEIIKQYPELQKSAAAAKDAAKAAENANDLSRESLESVQRSYVLFRGNKFNASVSQDITGKHDWVDFTATWENVGTTPANVLGHMYNITELAAEPTEDQFRFGVVKGEEPAYVTRTIGPHDPYIIGPFIIPFDRVLEGPRNKLYFFGWMVYRDIFAKSAIHVTEFCRVPERVGFLEKVPTDKIHIDFGFCRLHNCTDGYCDDYKQIISTVKKK